MIQVKQNNSFIIQTFSLLILSIVKEEKKLLKCASGHSNKKGDYMVKNTYVETVGCKLPKFQKLWNDADFTALTISMR